MRSPSVTRDRILCADTILTKLRCAVGTKEYSERRERQLQQLADILLCFCLDFPVQQAARLSRYRQPTVDLVYRKIRSAIARCQWGPRRIQLATTLEVTDREFSNSNFCRRCHKREGCHGRISGDAAIFGVYIDDGNIRIEPLPDEPILKGGMYDPPIVRGTAKDPYARYGGFICHGTFHRFRDRDTDAHLQDGLVQFWSWAEEKLHRYRGMRAANLGLYLKELEWKYNHRTMDPLEQACALIPTLPDDLVHSTK
ncbi:hypothetical protein HYZ98_01530 [Candidatus Peregrinibacteria bacterium]|nr:hypothetical protein [Candidatus Peregrinibacteria bacterium]